MGKRIHARRSITGSASPPELGLEDEDTLEEGRAEPAGTFATEPEEDEANAELSPEGEAVPETPDGPEASLSDSDLLELDEEESDGLEDELDGLVDVWPSAGWEESGGGAIEEPGLSVDPDDLGRQWLGTATEQGNFESSKGREPQGVHLIQVPPDK